MADEHAVNEQEWGDGREDVYTFVKKVKKDVKAYHKLCKEAMYSGLDVYDGTETMEGLKSSYESILYGLVSAYIKLIIDEEIKTHGWNDRVFEDVVSVIYDDILSRY
jgi:hypothetical protein